MEKISSKLSSCNKIYIKQKYKQKENSNIKVPEPDEFCKKKYLDNYMRSSAQSVEEVAQIGNILSQKTSVHVSNSGYTDKDI